MESKEMRLRPVVKAKDLLSLAARIRGDYPYCMTMYGNLLMNARGYNSCFQYKFYVLENYPDSHVVIWERKPYSIGFHCKEEEAPLLVKAIQDQHFMHLFKEDLVEVYHLPDYLLNPVHEIVQAQHSNRIIKVPHHTFTYVSNQNYPLRCPAGMRVRRLGKEGIRLMLEMGRYNKDDSVDLTCTLTANTPALGIYLDPTFAEETIVDLGNIDFAEPQAIPIAWISTYHYGSFGRLMTAEGYRGRGLGSLLTELMGRLYTVDGYIPHAHVDIENAASIGMFRKLAGWTDTYCSWWLCKDDEEK